jgi:hypothetical protein
VDAQAIVDTDETAQWLKLQLTNVARAVPLNSQSSTKARCIVVIAIWPDPG